LVLNKENKMKYRFPQGATIRFTLCLLVLLTPLTFLHAQAIANGTYTLTPQCATALRLDDEGARTTTGNGIDVYTANGTAAQNWAVSDTGVTPTGYYNLSTEGAYCLTASGTASGSAVVLDPCAGSSAQAWEAVASGSNFIFHPANNTALCLDVTGASSTSGTVVDVYTCNGTNAQSWAGPTASGSSGGGGGTTTTEGPYGGTAAAIPGTVQAENYDTGGQGVGYSVSSTNGSDNGYRSQGVDLEATTDSGGGVDLGWSASGQWFRYTVNVATAGAYTVSFRVAAESSIGDALHISNSSGTNLTGSVAVPDTGGWQTWQTVTANITLPAGKQTLTLNDDAAGWNINWFSFASGSSSGGGGGGTGTGSCSGIADISVGGKTYTPTWCQEFTGAAGPPSTSVWNFDLGNNGGWGNNEAEVYCGPPGYGGNPSQCPTSFSTSTAPVYIDGNGHLVIQVRNVNGTWISGRMNTEGKQNFQYGILEASIQAPDVNPSGLWPAFWTLGSNINSDPWPGCGESDIMELWPSSIDGGAGTTGNHSTIHTAKTGGSGVGDAYYFPNGEQNDNAFHTYGIVWQANTMSFFVDNPNSTFFTVTPNSLPGGDTWPFNANLFTILNVAVGGNLGGSTSGLNPGPMIVDYVRYYQ
jgi:beta-glucanase (GH16 family)